MGTFVYKVEISAETAIILKTFTNGEFIDSEEVDKENARKFISLNGLSFMYDDGEAKYYW